MVTFYAGTRCYNVNGAQQRYFYNFKFILFSYLLSKHFIKLLGHFVNFKSY